MTSVGGSGSEIRILRHSIAALGEQGLRPLTEDERTLAQESGDGPVLLGQQAALPAAASREATQIRNYYCGWQRGNGVIAAALQPQHVAFFAWLKCSQAEAERRQRQP